MKNDRKYQEVFCIRQSGFARTREKHYEGIFTQGSGYMHMRGSYEEGLEGANQAEEYMRLPANVTIEEPKSIFSKWGTYLPAITGRHPLLNDELVNLPYSAAFTVEINEEKLDMGNAAVSNYERWLDMRDGVLYRNFDWNPDKEQPDKQLKCKYRRFISAEKRNLLVQEMEYTSMNGDWLLKFYHNIDEEVRTNGYEHGIKKEKTVSGSRIRMRYETDTSDIVHMVSAVCSDSVFFQEVQKQCTAEHLLQAGKKIYIKKLTLLSSSADNGELTSLENMEKELVQLENMDTAVLYKKHRKVWNSYWKKAHIEIEGNEEDQKSVNLAIYHLLRCANSVDSTAAICAKGFSGEAYFGHFFWDTEIYLLPFYIYAMPETAKRLVEFRINTLPGAIKNAGGYGYKGARYPWESSVKGEEQCPNWQYADHEIHVTADVIFGIWHVWKATGDEQLLEKAVPVFIETARYWIDRVEWKADGTVHLNGVMGPDEYVCICNDNAYTNEMVYRTLAMTLEVIKWAKEKAPELLKKYTVNEEECKLFHSCATGIQVMKKNKKDIISQCGNFDKLEEPEFDTVWKERNKPYGYFVSQEKNYRTKALKQADVLMLPYLFPSDMSKEQTAANYDYYEPYTTHDSSLSAVVHGIICANMGRVEDAYHFFKRACEIDGKEEAGAAAEGIHIANCGGIWQAIVYGFAGMSRCYSGKKITFSPHIPKCWKSISFHICESGKWKKVKLQNEMLT